MRTPVIYAEKLGREQINIFEKLFQHYETDSFKHVTISNIFYEVISRLSDEANKVPPNLGDEALEHLPERPDMVSPRAEAALSMLNNMAEHYKDKPELVLDDIFKGYLQNFAFAVLNAAVVYNPWIGNKSLILTPPTHTLYSSTHLIRPEKNGIERIIADFQQRQKVKESQARMRAIKKDIDLLGATTNIMAKIGYHETEQILMDYDDGGLHDLLTNTKESLDGTPKAMVIMGPGANKQKVQTQIESFRSAYGELPTHLTFLEKSIPALNEIIGFVESTYNNKIKKIRVKGIPKTFEHVRKSSRNILFEEDIAPEKTVVFLDGNQAWNVGYDPTYFLRTAPEGLLILTSFMLPDSDYQSLMDQNPVMTSLMKEVSNEYACEDVDHLARYMLATAYVNGKAAIESPLIGSEPDFGVQLYESETVVGSYIPSIESMYPLNGLGEGMAQHIASLLGEPKLMPQVEGQQIELGNIRSLRFTPKTLTEVLVYYGLDVSEENSIHETPKWEDSKVTISSIPNYKGLTIPKGTQIVEYPDFITML